MTTRQLSPKKRDRSMSVTIEVRQPGKEWIYTAGFSSVQAAKDSCRELRKNGRHGYHQLNFRIYENNKLVFVNDATSGWRLRWFPGNGKSRDEQDD